MRPAAVTLVALAAFAVLGRAAELTTLQGTALITHIELADEVHYRTMVLRLGPDQVVRTTGLDEELLEGLFSGQRVEVTGVLNGTLNGTANGTTGSPAGAREPPSMRVKSIRPLEEHRAQRANVTMVSDPRIRINGDPTLERLPVSVHEPLMRSFRLLVIPLVALDDWGNACPGVQPIPYSKQDLENVMWGSRQYNLAGMYDECSGGRTRIDTARSTVTDFVRIGCSGNTAFGQWNMPGCADNDARGWQEHADYVVQTQMGINLAEYDEITYLAPPSNAQCGWLAMADYGCVGNTNGMTCRMWGHGWGWDSVAMYFHEYGHHFFLMHSGQVSQGALVEYADTSSTMGYCCAVRCMNTPQAFQLGWLPIVEIDGGQLTPGTTISLALDPQMKGRGVRVNPNWSPGSTAFFMGYRDNAGYDRDLDPSGSYGQKTNIYSAVVNDARDQGSSQWLSAIGDWAPSYADPYTGLTFRHLQREGAGVRVSICRYGGPEDLRSCCYGRDNDCNGLGGRDDPACAPLLAQCPFYRYQWDLGEDHTLTGTPSHTSTASHSPVDGHSGTTPAAANLTISMAAGEVARNLVHDA